MKPEDMNTLNSDGKAFNGNRGALMVAGITLLAVSLLGVVEVFKAVF